jgi:hypothetical protein
MTYTKKQFIEDVKKEARALRKNASRAELNKLEFEILNPSAFESCVYGCMTGDCRSPRAATLIHKSCKRYFHQLSGLRHCQDVGTRPMDIIKEKVKGSKVKGVESAKDFRNTRSGVIRYFSSIETYILMPGNKNKNLIAYLKGERNDLVL